MFKIEYEIKLNDAGRPYIALPENYEQNPEDKFFVLELSRYFLQNTYNNMTSPPYDQNTIDMMNITVTMHGQIGDEIANIIWHNMKINGEAHKLIGMEWDLAVQTEEERDAIPEHGIIEEDRLYLRAEGLKVFVIEGGQIYELRGGTTNNNWINIT